MHTGAAPALATLIQHGYVDALLGGNAIAVHDAARKRVESKPPY